MRKKVLVIVAATGLGVCFIAAVFYPSVRAIRIRRAVKSIDWLHADQEAVRQFSDRFGGSVDCSRNRCEFDVVATNRLLSAAHLAPRMYLDLAVHTDGDVVQDYVVSLGEIGKDAPDKWSSIWIIKEVVSGTSGVNRQPFEVNTSSAHKGKSVFVRLSSLATAEQQSVIDSLDLGCLSRLQGCSQQQLGPEIWRLGTFDHPAE